ncbi:MAG: AAC(3) family N-acetyltransferase [Anaeromyxobacter sp.]
MTPLGQDDVVAGLERLGLAGARVAVHTSLRSFGALEGGADAVVGALRAVCATVLAPAFCWDSNAPPPPGDRPARNGCDYAFYDGWTRPPLPFRAEAAGIQRSMGAVPRRLLELPGVCRSDHAWHSWAALGEGAGALTADHGWETTNLPLERLARAGGQVLLLGVGLGSCTAIHCAEERAGQRPFIRWATGRDGVVRRVRAAGCAKGFDALLPGCADLFREAHIGPCRALAAPLEPLIARAASLLRADPGAGRCPTACLRCRDAALGGPDA